MTAFNVNILEPYTFAGLLFGAMLPYAFTALTMKAVGDAAQNMIGEITTQINEMKNLTKPKTDLTDDKKDVFDPEYAPGKAAAYNLVKECAKAEGKVYPDTTRCVAIST